jgi:hypothetical protein
VKENRVVVVFLTTHTPVNLIGGKGATALASALMRNSTLQHLDVIRELRCDAVLCLCVSEIELHGCVW